MSESEMDANEILTNIGDELAMLFHGKCLFVLSVFDLEDQTQNSSVSNIKEPEKVIEALNKAIEHIKFQLIDIEGSC